ncbi:hypothetical protein [Agrilutibacter solisilvae]|uniref:CHAT domain-containing protein n=1 Tax=Agrilutibacter solisilvae TaxID=2763317 RepID=A0A974XWB5_9GAMM|nr:hypothetical protein [Lysobacter solisilvae]QSX76933.1 hypothetical protein I8J32_008845 [Lysobacter solisilvae]
MAERLKRENDIVTLKVELGAAGQVTCGLQFLDGGRLQTIRLWQGDIEEFGIPGDGTAPSKWVRGTSPRLPDALGPIVADAFNQQRSLAGDATRHETALWVHLVKPYGPLRFVPWERLLIEVLQSPVLMLPDFIFPPPRKSIADLDVAICASAPLNCEHHAIQEGVIHSIQVILDGLGEQPRRIHLFTEVEMARAVRGQLGDRPGLVVHPSEAAVNYVSEDPSSRLHDRSGSLRSPWLLWMRDTLRGYSTDVVHFVCHGHLSGRNGAMLLAQSPLGRTDNYLAGPVGAVELACFLTQVGAWSTTFSSPTDNHNPAGLRALADEIAQSMPGPMVLHDARLDASHEALGRAYCFIHSSQPQAPPCSPALYMYCQPYLLAEDRGVPDEYSLQESLHVRMELSVRNDAQRMSVFNAVAGQSGRSASNEQAGGSAGRSISGVTAATERVAEQVQLKYQKLLRDEVVPPAIAERDLQSAMGTVNRIRDAVAVLERERLLGEIDMRLDRLERNLDDSAVPDAETDEERWLRTGEEAGDSVQTNLESIHGSLQNLRELAGQPDSEPLASSSIDNATVEARTERVLERVARMGLYQSADDAKESP